MGCAWCCSLHWGQLAEQYLNYTVKFSHSLKQGVWVKAGWYQPQRPLKDCSHHYCMWQKRGSLQRTVQMLHWVTVKIRRKSCSNNQCYDSLHRNFSSEGTQKNLLCIVVICSSVCVWGWSYWAKCWRRRKSGQRLWDSHKKMKREEEHLLKNVLKDDCKGRKRGKRETEQSTC